MMLQQIADQNATSNISTESHATNVTCNAYKPEPQHCLRCVGSYMDKDGIERSVAIAFASKAWRTVWMATQRGITVAGRNFRVECWHECDKRRYDRADVKANLAETGTYELADALTCGTWDYGPRVVGVLYGIDDLLAVTNQSATFAVNTLIFRPIREDREGRPYITMPHDRTRWYLDECVRHETRQPDLADFA